jgi:hypothetical protein
MFKQPDIASIQPVARIVPTLAVDSIGSTTQEQGDRATQFVKGQEYFAKVLSKVGGTAYNVKVENESLKGALLEMDLGSAAKSGQTLMLRYLHDSPIPTFLLASSNTDISDKTTVISPAANMIGQYLKQAEGDGVSTRFQAAAIVSNSPTNPQQLASDLKNALSNSGLFYESHLSDMVQGNQSLAAIRQEPQNQGSSAIANLMTQQLAILENQRVAWHGEVWPGQKMDWDVNLLERNPQGNGEQLSNDPQSRAISSDLTLHLPQLGKVSARISLIDGHMRINLQAEQLQTIDLMKKQRVNLAQAIGKNGQQLDVLTVVSHE